MGVKEYIVLNDHPGGRILDDNVPAAVRVWVRKGIVADNPIVRKSPTPDNDRPTTVVVIKDVIDNAENLFSMDACLWNDGAQIPLPVIDIIAMCLKDKSINVYDSEKN